MNEPDPKSQSFLIVIPTYNERENIAKLIPAIRRALPVADILVVDDSSPDGTADVVDRFSADDAQVMLRTRQEKNGYGKAVTAGFQWGLDRHYTHILQMDADLSHDPKYLPEIIRASQQADLVLGSRYVPGGGTENWGLRRRILSRGGNAYARMILGLRVRDLTGGFRCWRRELLQELHLETIKASGYSFMIESLHRAVSRKARVVEVPIIFADRTAGRSKMSKRIISEALLLVWRIRATPTDISPPA